MLTSPKLFFFEPAPRYSESVMTDKFEIPHSLQGTYQRMLNRAPEAIRADSSFQHLTLLHLKVGGERLARQHTELCRLYLEEDYIFGRGFLQEKSASETGSGDQEDTQDESTASDADEAPDDAQDDATE
jgi:hypothetical protein